MKSRDEVKDENRKDYIKKGVKTQGQHSVNEFSQTLERKAINDSVNDRKDIDVL
ncbi:hypothetical protein GCM10008905_18560 [Clostridium malenominatum]|uniref:Uncharacterized protein n=1 Tax=Clostridium malenominatum TaxID=1539 RepID=A0ABN1IZC0_9CLOT